MKDFEAPGNCIGTSIGGEKGEVKRLARSTKVKSAVEVIELLMNTHCLFKAFCKSSPSLPDSSWGTSDGRSSSVMYFEAPFFIKDDIHENDQILKTFAVIIGCST